MLQWLPFLFVTQKIAVNEEGYSVMNTGQVREAILDLIIYSTFLQGAQRLPGYGQLGNVVSVCVQSLVKVFVK